MDIFNALTEEQRELAGKLSTGELVFCNLWLTSHQHGMTRAKCYMQAGLPARNISAAGALSNRLLRKPEVVEYCASMRGESARSTGLTLRYLDMQLKNMLEGSITDIVSSFAMATGTVDQDTGDPVINHIPVLRCGIDDIPPETVAAIESIKQGPKGIEVKMYNKLDALKLAYQRQGALIDRKELTGLDGKPLNEIPDEQLDNRIKSLLDAIDKG
jgi:hypothetical protein